MAEPVFSYEGDIAPQKGSYFSDIPRKGSGFTYSTATSQRYAADFLRPFQRANREAEEAELKRRGDELAYQRNRLLVEQAQKETQMQAELLAAEPALTARLEEINAMTDPVAQQKAVTDFAIENQKALQNDPIKLALDLISKRAADALNKQDSTNKASDASLYNQVIMYAGVDINKATEAAQKISNPHMQQQAAVLVASTIEKSKLQSDNEKTEEDKRKREKAVEDEAKNTKNAREKLVNLDTETVPGEMKKGKLPKQFTDQSMLQLSNVARDLGLSTAEIEKGLKDPFGFRQELLDRSYNSVAGSGAKRSVGGVTGEMMPTTTP